MATSQFKSGCLWALLGALVVPVLLVGVGLIVGGILVVNTAMKETHGKGYGQDEHPQLSAVWSYGRGPTAVVRIPISGVITSAEEDDLLFRMTSPAERVLRQIRSATQDPEVMAILIEIDSPGGGVTACDEIYRALLDFKRANPQRVIVALFKDIAASGGYYIACAADYIFAQPTTVTGSIGVLISTLNFSKLGNKWGIEDVTIKSGLNKDLLNPLREVSAEQRAILQEVVDTLQGRFVQLVMAGRNLAEKEVLPLADGRIFSAESALDHRLVDAIGYWEDAMAKTAQLLGVGTVKVFRYEEEFSFRDLLKVRQTMPIAMDALLRPPETRLQYLWQVP